MKRVSGILTAVLITLTLAAQDKLFNLQDVFTDPTLRPVSMRGLQWQPGSQAYTYVEENELIRASAKRDKQATLFTLDELNQAFTTAGLNESKRFPGYTWKDENTLRIVRQNQVIEYLLKEKTAALVTEIAEDAEGTEYAPVTGYAAYTKGNNLFIQVEGKEIALSTEPEESGIVFGQTVSRNEFGIGDGIFWSPDGTMLAFYRKDESKVSKYPLVDIEARVGEVRYIRYPMAGMESETITLGVYDTRTGETVYLKTGDEPNEYLTNITWSPDASHIFIAELNRGQDKLELNMYDPKGNFIRTILREEHEKYVEPEHGPLFDPALDPGQFIWFSERDGFNHIYLYSTEGQLIRQLTSGPWIVTGFLGFNEKGSDFFIMSTKESPLERHLYKVSFSDGRMTRVTPVHGTHAILISPDGEYAIDRYSSTEVAREYLLLDLVKFDSRVIKANRDPFEGYKMGKLSIFPITAQDSTQLYCRLILPPDFDPGRKYPVFIHLYGGPHSQKVTDSWTGGAGFFLNYMAQQGYVVFTLDNRGSAGRGFEFENVIHRNLGELEARDQYEGVKWLTQQQWVDADRIGIQGWSYGGYMTINMLLTYPEAFRAGIAGGPVIDWKYYEVMYGERYMDTPDENPDGYKARDLRTRIDSLESRLLIIHGSLDPVCVLQHSHSFIKASVDHGKQVDFFVYPGHEHGVRGMDNIHLWMKMIGYFEDHL